MDNSSNQVTSSHYLSAQSIFEVLIKRKRVAFSLDSSFVTSKSLPEELQNLLNQLSVIKSRAKKLYTDLGLGWEDSVIQKEFDSDKNLVIIFLDKPPEPKKFLTYFLE